MTTAADVIKMIKDNEVRYADLRFTDTKGKEQHVTVPARYVTDEFFVDGKMFDGSSIAGWKGINESDMILSAGSDHGRPRSVLRGNHPQPALRHHRARHDAGL